MKRIYLYSGEGTKHDGSSYKLIRHSKTWDEIAAIVEDRWGFDLESLWDREIGEHRCPVSPLLTVICELCLSEFWSTWGYTPDIVIGHSVGELAAAYQAGFYSLEAILNLAYEIGEVTARLDGVMMHGFVEEAEAGEIPVAVSSRNFREGEKIHVTVSGRKAEIDAFAGKHPDFREMRQPHPWHHPSYRDLLEGFSAPASSKREDGVCELVSGVTASFEDSFEADHWDRWLTGSIDFISSMDAIAERYPDEEFEVIEVGFHPVLEGACEALPAYTYVSSMYRGEDEIEWIITQRRKLDEEPILGRVMDATDRIMPDIDPNVPLSYQGFTSQTFVELTGTLLPYFPGLAPQDFYRFKSIQALIDGFAAPAWTTAGDSRRASAVRDVVVAGMSCRFPASAETPAQFWETLTGARDQVRGESGRGDFEAGFLDDTISRFDHSYFGISAAEAKTMDPQQILALELTEMLWRDAGIDPETLDKRRVGVYLGVWNDEYEGDRSSVYFPTGTNPSIIASRISYHYDLRGPSWIANTACSSSLIAVHYAAKDIEAGRVDVAIVGGVNMLLGETFTDNMRTSGFLSKDGRCKAFDDSANGYVRSEGGGLVLLTTPEIAGSFYGSIAGSSINQNGRRPQVITAPHPEAQEEVISDACIDAGIEPQEITYVECHGTGTRIGDPIEISAIQNTIARNRETTCYLGSVKSNIGHLESAAGMAGLIKALLALNRGVIPPDLHFDTPNQYIDFDSFNLKVVDTETPIDHEAYAGVSSFGFGGSNAHIVIAGAPERVRKPVAPVEVPFDRSRAKPLTEYFSLERGPVAAAEAAAQVDQTASADVATVVHEAFFEVTGINDIDADIELIEQGLDSLGSTQFITTIQKRLGVELDPDLFFDYPLVGQLIEHLESLPREQPSVEAIFPDEAGANAGTAEAKRPQSREEIEAAVNRIFFEVTSIESVDADVELIEQGLDSLGATQFVTQIQKEIGVELDPDVLFDYPLAGQLIDYLAEKQSVPAS